MRAKIREATSPLTNAPRLGASQYSERTFWLFVALDFGALRFFELFLVASGQVGKAWNLVLDREGIEEFVCGKLS